MKYKKIPKDLTKHVISYIVKKIVLFVLMEAILATVRVLWGDWILGSSVGAVKCVLCIIVFLIPFVVTKIPFCLLDKTYFGVIELQLRMETSLENERPFKPTLEGQYTAVTAVLTVKEEDSDKRHTVKVRVKGSVGEKNSMFDTYADRSGDGYMVNAEDAYKVGARVFHLCGTKHVVILPDENSQSVCCAVCGEANSVKGTVCRKCGHTLVK